MKRAAKPLPDDAVRDLARRWRKSGDIAALQQVITSNLGLAHRIARRYASRSIDFDDLFQEAVLGLIKGCERYDPDRPERITTYVQWWAHAYVRKYAICNNGPVRFGTYALDRKIIIMINSASKASAGNIDVEDIAFVLDTTVENVRLVQQRLRTRDISLSSPSRRGDAGSDTFEARLPDLNEPGPERRAMTSEFLAQVDAVLAQMAPREALIVRRRVLNDETETLESIGDELGLTRERVRQLEARALEHLRRALTPRRARKKAA